MCYFVYILRNQNGKYYIGYTGDLFQRMRKHNSGGTKSTKNKGRWEIIYSENFKNKKEAIFREKYIKRQKSRNFIESLILSRGVEK